MVDRMRNLSGQPMFDVLAQAKTHQDMIHFEIGDTYYDTPAEISNAAITSILSGDTHYCPSSGIDDFREAIRETTAVSRGFLPKARQILVTPGANIGIYYTALATLNPGDEVIIPDPYFPTYRGAFEFVGAKCVMCPLRPERNFELDPADVLARITPKTKLIVMNSPHNPTGAVMKKDDVRRVYEIALANNCYLLSDEVYSRSIYEGDFFSPSVYDACAERVIVLNGFGKAFAMTGWRLGVMIGPPEIIEKMGVFLQLTSSCVPPFIQRAGIAAIRSREASSTMAKRYRHKRDMIVAGLNAIDEFECNIPHGAFYAFPNITGTGLGDIEIADRCMQNGVAVMPGSYFGDEGRGRIRLCFAVEDCDIVEGLIRIKKSL